MDRLPPLPKSLTKTNLSNHGSTGDMATNGKERNTGYNDQLDELLMKLKKEMVSIWNEMYETDINRIAISI